MLVFRRISPGWMERLAIQRGAPKYLFADTGAQFIGQLVDLWAYHHGVRIDFSRPGKPTDNAFIETFNGSLRDECLNLHWLETMAEARVTIEAWRRDYNEPPSHGSWPSDATGIPFADKPFACGGGLDDRRRLTLDLDHQSQAPQDLVRLTLPTDRF